MNLKACVLLSAVLFASPALATPIVSVAPRAGDPTVVGSPFTVDVSLAGIIDPAVIDLIAFQFDFAFDPNLMSITAVEPGSALGDPFDESVTVFTFLSDVNVSAGSITGIFGAIAGQLQEGVLASLTFDALAGGTSSLLLSNVSLIDPNGDPLDDFDVSQGSVTITAPTDVTPVPEPATMLLLGTGLMAALRKHRARPSNQ